jgi:Icc-related predicted phosphoesterase
MACANDKVLGMIRIAAVGDVHLGPEVRGTMRPHLADIGAHADVLLLAGDLTGHGTADEAELAAAEFRDLDVPVIAVLGNHDYLRGEEREITRVLRTAGITVLEDSGTVITGPGGRVGVAGTTGFAGGFPGQDAAWDGDPETNGFVRHWRRVARGFGEALAALDADFLVALTHYAPVTDTLAGEPPELYQFLGNHVLAEVIDGAATDLAIHAHAHAGQECGMTPGGVAVRNVALPVLRRPYGVYVV